MLLDNGEVSVGKMLHFPLELTQYRDANLVGFVNHKCVKFFTKLFWDNVKQAVLLNETIQLHFERATVQKIYGAVGIFVRFFLQNYRINDLGTVK